MSDIRTIVLAHGRAAHYEIAETEARLWGEALTEGLLRIGSEYAHRVRVEYAYFGGLWRRDTKEPMPVVEGMGSRRYTVRLSPQAQVVAESARLAQAQRGLGSIATEIASLAPGFVIDGLLARAIPDVYDYLDSPTRREAADAVVENVCRSTSASVLVGYSMGSIVGYQVLRHASPSLSVRAFVTCGSPLGLDAIHRRIGNGAETPFPPSVQQWINVWNADDVATGVHGPELSALFPDQQGSGRTIQNVQSYGRPASVGDIFAAHDAIVYLSSLATALAVHVALADSAT